MSVNLTITLKNILCMGVRADSARNMYYRFSALIKP